MNKQEFEFCVRFKELGSSEIAVIGELIDRKYLVDSCAAIADRHVGKSRMSIGDAARRLRDAGIITYKSINQKRSMFFLNDDWEKILMDTPCEWTKPPVMKCVAKKEQKKRFHSTLSTRSSRKTINSTE